MHHHLPVYQQKTAAYNPLTSILAAMARSWRILTISWQNSHIRVIILLTAVMPNDMMYLTTTGPSRQKLQLKHNTS